MDRIPEEVALHILSFLEVQDLVRLQAVSHRYLELGRDDSLWKIECFDRSRVESLRRHQKRLDAQDARVAELRNAVSALPGGDLTAWDVSQLRGSAQPRASEDPKAEAKKQKARALANWEPAYPGERFDYYEEYVQRHAEINVGWLDIPKNRAAAKDELREATGMGILSDPEDDRNKHMISPLDDGSVCIWDISSSSTMHPRRRRKLVGQSQAGLLTGLAPGAVADSHICMTETGAVECLSIDNQARKGYFAVQNNLHELDLNTLQIVSTKHYPWPITAVSDAKPSMPVTIGTNWTVHLLDPRDSGAMPPNSQSNGELIGGSVYSHATLEESGPLSILHGSGLGGSTDSIWVAGRFTSLLNYDRRFFPRLLGTVHSGARIASLSAFPHPFIPRDLDLVRNPNVSLSTMQAARNASGITMLAAAEYKGKGSLELYGLPAVQTYQNRQTASASKLLSAAPHGGRIVFSDGDGNLKWMERDGFSYVRTFNINDAMTKEQNSRPANDRTPNGIWSTNEVGQGDIVQKIIPSASGSSSSSTGRDDINQSNLFLWTGDGRLGVLGFGSEKSIGENEINGDSEAAGQSTEQKAKEDAERQYGMAMRRALERNADEVRFVRGLGMA